MTFDPSGPRQELHFRNIELRGYRRAEGLFDIEAHLVDTKSSDVTVGRGRMVRAGERIHDMSIRLVVNAEMCVIDVAATMDAAIDPICPQAVSALGTLKGATLGAGWSRTVRERLAGIKGCTHLMELLMPMATVAFQTLWEERQRGEPATKASGEPAKIDSCYAYAGHRDLVRDRWPMFYRPNANT